MVIHALWNLVRKLLINFHNKIPLCLVCNKLKVELERKPKTFSRERIHYTRLWSCLALSKTLKPVDIKGLLWLKLIDAFLIVILLCNTLIFESRGLIQVLKPSLFRSNSIYIVCSGAPNVNFRKISVPKTI